MLLQEILWLFSQEIDSISYASAALMFLLCKPLYQWYIQNSGHVLLVCPDRSHSNLLKAWHFDSGVWWRGLYFCDIEVAISFSNNGMFTNENRIWNVTIESYKKRARPRGKEWLHMQMLLWQLQKSSYRFHLNIYDLRLCINLTLYSSISILVTPSDKKTLNLHFSAKWCLLSGLWQQSQIF